MNILDLKLNQEVGFTTQGESKVGTVVGQIDEVCKETNTIKTWIEVDVLGEIYEVPLNKLLGLL